jgi:hypothetical protein
MFLMIGENHFNFGLLGVPVFLCLVLLMPSPQRASFSPSKPVQVVVDVFSGRPNPRWDLSAPQVGEFLKNIRALPHKECAGELKDGLGYRGLKVTGSELSREGYNEIVISNGIVEVREESRAQQFADRNRALERWLLQTGKGKIEDKLYEYLSEESSKELR